MAENELAVDEARWPIRNETNTAVAAGVDEEIVDQATPSSLAQPGLARLTARMRRYAIEDTAKSQRVIGEALVPARGSPFINYGFGVLFALLTTRLVLALSAASSSNGFVQLVTAVTNPFYAPFRGIVPSPTGPSGHTLVVPLVIAIAAYALLLLGIKGLLRMVGTRETRI